MRQRSTAGSFVSCHCSSSVLASWTFRCAASFRLRRSCRVSMAAWRPVAPRWLSRSVRLPNPSGAPGWTRSMSGGQKLRVLLDVCISSSGAASGNESPCLRRWPGSHACRAARREGEAGGERPPHRCPEHGRPRAGKRHLVKGLRKRPPRLFGATTLCLTSAHAGSLWVFPHVVRHLVHEAGSHPVAKDPDGRERAVCDGALDQLSLVVIDE